MFRRIAMSFGVLACFALAQCKPVEVATGTQSSRPVAGQTFVVSAEEVGKLNSLRAIHGLPPVQPDPTLARIANLHARDMMTNGFFGHISSNGNTIVERTHAQGYGFCHVAENLAKGIPRFETVLSEWMTSPTHRANVLHGQVTEIGLVRGPGNLWVMVLGSPGC